MFQAITQRRAAAGADVTNPTVALTSPNGGERWGVGLKNDITWTASDDTAVSSVDLDYSTDSGSSWIAITTGLSNSGTYEWTVPNAVGATVKVRATARDAATNSASDASDAVFSIATGVQRDYMGTTSVLLANAAPTITLASVTCKLGDTLIVGVNSDIVNNDNPGSVNWDGINGDAGFGTIESTSGTNNELDVFTADNLAAGTHSITVTASSVLTGNINGTIAVWRLRGLKANPLDKSKSATGSSTSPTTGNTAATTQAIEWIEGVLATEGALADAAGTWGNSLTAGVRVGIDGFVIGDGYKRVTSTGVQAASKTGITSARWMIAVFAFKEGP
jgi:hypothetical protein